VTVTGEDAAALKLVTRAVNEPELLTLH